MPIVRMVMNMRTKCPRRCCIFVTGKQVKLLGWHLRLVETSRTNRSDYSFTPIRIIRTPCRNYFKSTNKKHNQHNQQQKSE